MYMFLQRRGLNSMTKQRTLGFSKAFEIHLLNGFTQYQTNQRIMYIVSKEKKAWHFVTYSLNL